MSMIICKYFVVPKDFDTSIFGTPSDERIQCRNAKIVVNILRK